MPNRKLVALLVGLCVLVLPLPVLAQVARLAAPPEGDRWFSVNMGGERVGFAHLRITRVANGYRIESESGVKMKGLGFSREASSKELYLVRPDLSVVSFEAETRIDKSPMEVKGEVLPDRIRLTVDSGGTRKERTLKSKGAVYPPEALNIYPLMKGASKGTSYKVPMLDLESVKVKQVKVKVIGEEHPLQGPATVHLSNDLYPIVDNDVWVDAKGNTVKEAVREDLIVTLAEDEATAKQELANDALAKKDLVLDFSLIPVVPPIEHPEQLQSLTVALSGAPDKLPILLGRGQKGQRQPDGTVVFTMPNPDQPGAGEAGPGVADLETSQRIPTDAPEIVAQMKAIVGAETDRTRQVRFLTAWVAKEVKGTVIDSQSPLETLKIREGNCQSHARLFTALARAAAIPSRFVSGIVYSPGNGYLYHSWAESYLGGWVPIDPTFGEFPANVTHIKLVEGDSPDEMALLAGVIGRVGLKVIKKVDR